MDGTIIRSFIRSKLRLTILRNLLDVFPGELRLSTLSGRAFSDPSSVTFALRGDGIRYSRELSLTGLGLVEERKTRGGVYYGIIPDRLSDVNEILFVARSFNLRKKNVEVVIE